MKKLINKTRRLRLPPEFYFVSRRNRIIKNKKKEIQKLKCRYKHKHRIQGDEE